MDSPKPAKDIAIQQLEAEVEKLGRRCNDSCGNKAPSKRGKPDHMTDEAWRQLSEVIPFRIRRVEKGCHLSLAVLMISINKIACELDVEQDVKQASGLWSLPYEELKQLQEQNTKLNAKLALYERIKSKPDQVVEEIMGLAFKMAGMVQLVKYAPDGKERRHKAVDELEQAVTNLDNIASECQSTCDRQAMKLAQQEAVMKQALEALIRNDPYSQYAKNLAIKTIEDALK